MEKIVGPPNVYSGNVAVLCEISASILNYITLWTKYHLALLKFENKFQVKHYQISCVTSTAKLMTESGLCFSMKYIYLHVWEFSL